MKKLNIKKQNILIKKKKSEPIFFKKLNVELSWIHW